MRFLLLMFLFCAGLFSAQITPEQIQLIQQAGYSQEDLSKALSNTTKEEVDSKKEQIVQNVVVKEVPEEQSTSSSISRYASQFFNNKNNIDPYSIPTPQNYILNYADKITINIFGGQNQKFNLPITKDGNITIPQVGELKIIGLSFEEAKKLILDETKKAYPNSTNILVDISEFSSIQVTISGLVNAPGLYNLSSFSTIKDALINSGGILNSGSYRNISLKRDGEIIKTFDLYSLVRYGSSSSDMVLKNGDIIMVNPISTEVILKGQVKNQAIYELKSKESFKTLFDFASGLEAKANTNAIKLKRYINNNIKVYTLSLDELYKMTPSNGDEIEVFALSAQNANLVKITGNVLIPGEKELPRNASLTTLLNNELKIFGQNGFFKENTNYDYALIKNLDISKSFNLKKVLSGETPITIKSGDEIRIFNKSELQDIPYIYAQGEIVNDEKRKYDFYDGLKAKDLFSIVNFKTEKVVDDRRIALIPDKTKVQVNRVENDKKITYFVDIQTDGNFEINAYDEVTFFDFSSTNDIKKATIKGEVFIPGTYNITTNTSINDLIKIAGGFTKKTLMTRCEVARYEIKDNERIRTILNLDLQKAIDLNLQILEDDEWTIFAIENWNEKKYVDLKGEVRYPGRYNITEGEKLSSVIARAGGFTNHAFVEGAVFAREEVKQLQIQRIEESLDRIRTKAIQANASANDIGEKTQDKQNMLLAVTQLEKEAAAKKPIGRISINLYYDLARFTNSPYDLTLKDKDTLYVPSVNDTISVVGEVLNQNTFIYNSKYDAKDYLEKAGGATELADKEYIYIVKANGEAQRVKNDYFWGSSNEVFKGDTIVVPMKIDTVSDLAFTKDVTQVLYQLAITAASLKTVGGI
ncbi:polysaccharide biosynthesis/export family protein [Aliarcobacter cryaerophilus]|uniref:polysaccharide biosynthesis/export family protein n=1 Tax=Aliarcobacter cryaerophilus TaxID=28198 RepID=UPI0021B24C9B|nr:SLBB domain-containing protein [Aliarcobacter cryaerophilus]MCT7468914.1 SLBB domain-containing protein [Aliarcobacter cryaerophilus]